MLRLIACPVGAATLTGWAAAAESPDPEQDKTAIEAALRQWPEDFNDENVGGVCGYCARMQTLFNDPEKRYSYPAPDIREVLVDGDLATVTLFWTLAVTDPAGNVLDTGVDDGLDVFRQQPDGTWKVHVSHAFTK